jgi:geranylgeranyl reductase family protein
MLMRETDAEAIVVGGGPAGSTIAAALATAGHRVLLLDKASFPRHKPCSDYLNAGGRTILAGMGVLDEVMRAGAREINGMVVHAPNGNRFTADFAMAEPGQCALGLSRRCLDQLLLDRARAAGVTVREHAHVRDLIRDGDRVAGVEATIDGVSEQIRAPLVIGADGRYSVVARTLDLTTPLRWPRKTGLAAHYRGVTGLDGYGEMHVGHGVYAGLAPIEHGMANLTIVLPDRSVEDRPGSVDELLADALGRLLALAQRLDGAERVGSIRGVGSMGQRARRTTGDGFLLIGDAASFLDPFPGEGIYEALKAALLAAPVASAALRSGDTSAVALEPYWIARRHAFTAKRQVCWIVQGFVNAPPLMNYVTDRLARRDDLGMTLSGVLGNLRPATQALSPLYLARLLRP